MLKKRFIAGASCPQCKQLDKVYTYEKEGRDYAACTHCDYLDARPTEEELRIQHAEKEQTPMYEEETAQVKWLKRSLRQNEI